MTTVGVYEAKTHLPSLLDRVARGERITITRHGVAVATLSPVASGRDLPVGEVISELKRFREENPVEAGAIREMIREGRR